MRRKRKRRKKLQLGLTKNFCRKQASRFFDRNRVGYVTPSPCLPPSLSHLHQNHLSRLHHNDATTTIASLSPVSTIKRHHHHRFSFRLLLSRPHHQTTATAVLLLIMHTARLVFVRSPPGTTVGGW